MKSCRFARFTDNFLRFNATPGNLDWIDDAGWTALADKAGQCAWLMKQAGAKGLAIDFESYGAHQFRFDAAKGRAFADTAALARKRGAQFVQTIAREFPDAVLLTLWMNSINLRAAGTLTNLARNAEFVRPAGRQDAALPAEFSIWQDEKTPAGKLVILLNITGQAADTDVCWFDNLVLYRLR